jgi:hypothetical protein
MIMGSTERRIACLKIAAAMNKRMTKEDPITSVDALIKYATALEEYAWRGERTPVGVVQDGKVVFSGEIQA